MKTDVRDHSKIFVGLPIVCSWPNFDRSGRQMSNLDQTQAVSPSSTLVAVCTKVMIALAAVLVRGNFVARHPSGVYTLMGRGEVQATGKSFSCLLSQLSLSWSTLRV